MNPTEALVTFAVRMDGKSLPPDVVHAAWRSILDCLGVALAGSVEPCGQIIAAQAQSQGGSPESVIWGSGARVSAGNAALANGTAAHVLDYDDVSPSMPGHPSVPVLPAVMAVGERLGSSGRAILEAFLVGLEVECKLGQFTGQETFDVGWHGTTTLGVIGAAAGVGRLMGLDVTAMRRAIGIAVSQACGVRQNFGTMTKPLHVGRAAESAILAVELVQRGFTASETGIEGMFGYWDMFGGPLSRDGDALAQAMGNPFDVIKPGIHFKVHPCCSSTHAAVDSALQITGGLSADAIEGITVDIPYTAPLVLIHHQPKTALAGKFSLEYCVAAALLDGCVTVNHFRDEAVNRPDLQALLQKVEYRVPDAWQKGAGPWKLDSARVEVRLKDGSVRRGATDLPRGNAANPLGDDELEAKFLDCASSALGGAQASKVLALVQALEGIRNVGELTQNLMVPA